MLMTIRRTRRGLREYTTGVYPVPAWSYGAPAAPAGPCCGQKTKGMGRMSSRRANSIVAARMAGLGYTGPYDASLNDAPDVTTPSVATGTGSVPIVDYNPSIWVQSGAAPAPDNVYPVTPGGGQLSTIQLATLATGMGTQSTQLPAVSPATLLAAAALPNAPTAVKQAAAAYTAANPLSSFLQGSILGLPTYLVLGGGLLAVLALAGSSKRR